MVLFCSSSCWFNVGAEEEGRAPIFHRPSQVATALLFSLLLILGLLHSINKAFGGPKDKSKLRKQRLHAARGNKLSSRGLPASVGLSTETERMGNSPVYHAALAF